MLWSYYSNDCCGYNIEFKKEELLKHLNKDEKFGVLNGKVIYKVEQQKEIIIKILQKEYESYIASQTISDHIFELFEIYSLFFKNELFAPEEESRIVFWDYKLNESVPIDIRKKYKPKFREKNNLIVPYIERNFPEEGISSICIGPKSNTYTTQKSIKNFLETNDYSLNNIQVNSSEIPLRY